MRRLYFCRLTFQPLLPHQLFSFECSPYLYNGNFGWLLEPSLEIMVISTLGCYYILVWKAHQWIGHCEQHRQILALRSLHSKIHPGKDKTDESRIELQQVNASFTLFRFIAAEEELC